MLRVAEYLRLSRKDGDKAESDSIANQKEMLDSYIAKHSEFVLYDRYIDDDYSGTNFNRPGFIRMMNDIEDNNIDVVIVKDLSRFGRDYVDTGRYLQKVFPRLGVRFISLSDNIDSGKQAYDMLMPIRNIFNEQYARDISGKILASIKTKQEAGRFIGAFACYGYLKSPEDKNKLVIDPYAASVVRRIYDMFIGGEGKQRIAKILNKDGILCPSEYKKNMDMNYRNGKRMDKTHYWTYSTINVILHNEIYTGTMVQNKADQSRFNARGKRTILDEDEWIKVPNTHEAIIDEEAWQATQSLLTKRTRQLDFSSNASPYAGFLKCADCGRAMSKIVSNGKARYVCGTFKRYGKEYCSNHRIYLEELNSIVVQMINDKLERISNLLSLIESAEEAKKAADSKAKEPVSAQIEKLRIRIGKISKTKKGLYEDYKAKLLTRDEFIGYKADYQSQEDALLAQIEALEASVSGESDIIIQHPWLKKFKETKHISEITRPVLDAMVKEIIIHEGNKIQIKYKFDPDSI